MPEIVGGGEGRGEPIPQPSNNRGGVEKGPSRASGKCCRVVHGGPERSWSTKGGRGPHGPPGPHRSALIHTF